MFSTLRCHKSKEMITNIRHIPRYLNTKTIGIGTLAALMACTGPLLIVINASQNGDLSSLQTLSWVFGIYVFAGLYGIWMSLRFAIPIAGAYSIPSAVLMTQAITQFSFEEAIAGYLIAGILIFLIGVFGWFQKVIQWLPIEIVMAMIAGAMIHFAVNMLHSIFTLPIVGGLSLVSYFLISRLFPKIPPAIGALVVGITLFILKGDFSRDMGGVSYQWPALWIPEFSLNAIIVISIPITVMLLSTEAAQGVMVLKKSGYQVPTNTITRNSGIATIFASFFGGHSACIGGIMSAVCTSEDAGMKNQRYVAAFVSGVLLIVFGLLASIVVDVIILLPGELISLIAGIALLGVLLNSLQQAFKGQQFQMGAFFSLVIAMSGISFYGFSSTFLALAGGVIISWVLEPEEFMKRLQQEKADHDKPKSA